MPKTRDRSKYRTIRSLEGGDGLRHGEIPARVVRIDGGELDLRGRSVYRNKLKRVEVGNEKGWRLHERVKQVEDST